MDTRPLTEASSAMNRRLRNAGVLIILGLLVELITLLWTHPLAFIAFLAVGGLLIGLGILLYLWSLVSLPQREGTSE